MLLHQEGIVDLLLLMLHLLLILQQEAIHVGYNQERRGLAAIIWRQAPVHAAQCGAHASVDHFRMMQRAEVTRHQLVRQV